MRKSLSYSELASENKQIEHEVKMVQKQIVLAEKTLAVLLRDFTNVTVDLTRLHSREREFCDTISSIAPDESPSFRSSLLAISGSLQLLLEALSAHIGVLQTQVVNPISERAKNCKEARSILEKCTDAKKKQAAALKALSKRSLFVKHRNNEMHTNTFLESTKQLNELTSEMIRFEKSKAEDLKSLVKIYIHSNLAYHVKAVEQYTKAYQAISLVDVDEHVEHFMHGLTYSEKTERGLFVKHHSLNALNPSSNSDKTSRK